MASVVNIEISPLEQENGNCYSKGGKEEKDEKV